MRYSTINNWAKYFEETEVIHITPRTIRIRLIEAGKIGMTARNNIGIVLKNAFFSEADVRSACADLIQTISHADEEGFLVKDGEKYGTIGVWPKVLEISETAIKSRVKTHNPKSIKGKDSIGKICNFYSESAIREVCADLLEDILQADEKGFFEKDGQKYGTITVWSVAFGISHGAILSRIIRHDLQGVKGKDKNGHICDFYLESAICEICSDLLEDLPQTYENGFFEKDGQRYRTTKSWSKLLGISEPSITKRIITHNIQGIKGKDKIRKVRDFYSESIIHKICADLLEEIPQADETGFFIKDGEKYGSIEDLSKEFGISGSTIVRRIKTHNPQSIKGKNKRGNIYDFYTESVIRELCADLLQPLPQADESGFFGKDSEKYGLILAWAKSLGVSASAITRRIKSHNPKSLKGKMKGGQIYNFYPESAIRQLCADILAKKQK